MASYKFTDLLSTIVDNRGRSCPVVDAGFPLIATNCIKPDQIYPTFENIRYVDEITYTSWFRGHPEPNDIIFVCKGSPGRVALVPDPVPFCIAQDMVSLRADPNVIHYRYLYYLLASQETQRSIENLHVGTMIPHFKKGDFGKLNLRIHESIVEQRAIAEVLGALDDKIAANRNLAKLVDELLATKLDSTLDCSEAQYVRIDEIAAVNREAVKPVSGGQLRYVDIASVGVGGYEFPELTMWEDAPSRARRRMISGDILWSTVRPNRRSHALNLSDDARLVASTGLAVLSPTRVGSVYLYEVLRRPEFTAHLESVAEGSAYPAVRQERFAEAMIPLVSLSLREKFEALATPLRESVYAAEGASRTLGKLRDTLLPQLMSGKLRVRDAEKQVEAVL